MKELIKKLIPFWLGRKLKGAYQKISSLWFAGSQYYCPYCNRSFRKFLPGGFDLPVIYEKKIIGAGFRPNDVCPRCYSLDRDRLIWIFLKEKTNIFTAPINLFHVAPEGCLRALLSGIPSINYNTGVKYLEGYYYDRNTSMVDITSLPFEDDTFDVIICNHVLEHIPDDLKAIREIYRTLKPGGWAILQVPVSAILQQTYENPSVTTAEEREKHFGQFDHVRIYGQDYPERLKKAGFMVKKFNPTREKWLKDLSKFAINPDEDLFIAYK